MMLSPLIMKAYPCSPRKPDQPAQQKYFTSGRFKLTAYKTNLYILFLERGLGLIRNERGRLGYIIPKSLAFNTYFATTRTQILQNFIVPLIVEIRDKVFAEVEVGDSLLFFAQNTKATDKPKLCYRVVKNVTPAENILEEFRDKNFALLCADSSLFRPNGLGCSNKIHIVFDEAGIVCYISPLR